MGQFSGVNMRSIGYYFLIIIVVVVILPLAIVKGCGGFKKDLFEDKKGSNIKLYIVKTKEIKDISFEDYIRGVVAAEMPASYHIEALKAQAIAARTYASNKIRNHDNSVHTGADVCSDPAHCQAWVSKEDAFKNWAEVKRNIYWDKISWAVKSTAGQMIYYDDQLANPVFHSNSGGRTENAENVWAGSPVPYLRGVDSLGEENASQYQSQVEFTVEELVEKIKKDTKDFQIDKDKLKKEIIIKSYTENDRVREIQIGNKTYKGTDARRLLGLKSVDFSVNIIGSKIVFKVKGYGHGVGMSQCGANSMAQSGKTYKDILKHYYQGVEIR